jgi:hypothetical protein
MKERFPCAPPWDFHRRSADWNSSQGIPFAVDTSLLNLNRPLVARRGPCGVKIVERTLD